MYQALYRKWRPKTFGDVVGQQNITATLANEVEHGNISHAYLFTGTRGTGKTTCAKILAKAVNCLNPQNGNPCNVCELCTGIESGAVMDIVELDAASNNGVEDIREIIDETNFTPVQSKYRVYIIDEVHMLTASASNAFLKTLEEPPAHVVFILATTDPQKLLPTVRSRCQRFDFRRIGPEDIANQLAFIADKEGFALDPDAAALIARIADGGLRDAISLLDLCSVTDRNITLKTVGTVVGIADKEFLFVLTDCIKNEDTCKALETINELHNSFSDMGILCSEMLNHLRSLMLIKTVKSAEDLIVCTKADYIRLVRQAGLFTLDEILHAMFLLEQTSFNLTKGYNKRTELELAFIRLCSLSLNDGRDAVMKRLDALEDAVGKGAVFAPSAHTETVSTPATSQPAVMNETPELKYNQPEYQASLSETAAEPTPDTIAGEVPAPEPAEESSADAAADGGNVPAGENEPGLKDLPEQTEGGVLSGAPGESDIPPVNSAAEEGQEPFAKWPDVLSILYDKDPAFYAFLRSSWAVVEKKTLFICMEKPEAAEGLAKSGSHMTVLQNIIASVSAAEYTIKFLKKDTGYGIIKTVTENGLLNIIKSII